MDTEIPGQQIQERDDLNVLTNPVRKEAFGRILPQVTREN
jgi:hypothetical protein